MIQKGSKNNMIVEVTGDMACYTVPPLKATRVTYPVPTPSALEGMLKCIHWKPAFDYIIDEIVVLNPIETISFSINEVSEQVSTANASTAMKKNSYLTVDTSTHIMRSCMVLRNVRYVIKFRIELTGYENNKTDSEIKRKHYEMIERRLKNQQFHSTPYLGCRDFLVKEMKWRDSVPYDEIDESLKGTKELGFMLYGIKYPIPDKGTYNKETVNFNSKDCPAIPIYYKPVMVDGVIDVERYRGTCVC